MTPSTKAAPRVGFTATIVRHGPGAYFELPFDPKEAFGKLRAPVKVTLNGFTFRTTIAAMGGPPCIGLRASNREAAKVDDGDRVEVRLDLDTEERVVTPPPDLVKALKAVPGAWDRWRGLSFTHQREHAEAVEGAKKPETRTRRIANAVAMITAAKPKKRT
ncbi:MAG TPA: YdeI/OmpD-associated family protein [Vicinamibacterales bacterium]|jgi:hypothetical protein|nr:YdeI/OmpD-associated family protein [Vicinamibacterales bacterium]